MSDPLTRLVTELARLPAHHVLRISREETDNLAQALIDVKEKLFHCSVCNSITDRDPCTICSDPEKRLAPEIREMILHALAKKPEQRYQSAQSWVEEIDRLQKKWPLEQDHIVEARQWLAVSADDDESTWKPGSTQSKLDRNFGLEATPRPAVDRTPDDKTRTVLDESTNEKPDNNEPAIRNCDRASNAPSSIP